MEYSCKISWAVLNINALLIFSDLALIESRIATRIYIWHMQHAFHTN